jgi:DNA-binding transcriptional MerR regulator
MMQERGYLRIGDGARYLGISPSTLRNWERTGKIATYRHPINNYRLFKQADLDALLQQIDRSRRDPSTGTVLVEQECAAPAEETSR